MPEVKRYRSLPQEVEAIQWTGNNIDDVMEFAGEHVYVKMGHGTRPDLHLLAGVDGVQGWVHLPRGDWIVKGGFTPHFWWVDPVHFQERYEEIS